MLSCGPFFRLVDVVFYLIVMKVGYVKIICKCLLLAIAVLNEAHLMPFPTSWNWLELLVIITSKSLMAKFGSY
jgi:hypothetical protein